MSFTEPPADRPGDQPSQPAGAHPSELERRQAEFTAFVTWAQARAYEVDPMVVDAAVTWRLRYSGPYGRWTGGNFRALLTEWIPSKVLVVPDALDRVIPTLHHLVDFLAETEPEVVPGAPALHVRLDALTDEFLLAASDERNYDLAKFWAMRMLAAGYDLDDSDQMDEFVERSSAGEIDIDPAVLDHIMARQFGASRQDDGEGTGSSNAGGADDASGPGAVGGEGAPPDPEIPPGLRENVPPVRLSPDAQLEPLAAETPLVTGIRVVERWVGPEGRELAAEGQPRPADAHELARHLDYLGAENAPVREVLTWARAAGAVRVVEGRLVRSEPGNPAESTDGRALELWRRAFANLATIVTELLASPTPGVENPAGVGPSRSGIAEDPVTLLPVMLLGPYLTAGNPIPLDAVQAYLLDVRPVASVEDRELTRQDLVRLTRVLESMGAVEVEDTPAGLAVSLTALGLAGARAYLRDSGYDAPSVDEVAARPLGELLELLDGYPPPAVEEVLHARADGSRPEAELVADLVVICRESMSPSVRAATLEVLGGLGEAGLEAMRRLRAADGPIAAIVGEWLVRHELLDPDEVSPAEATYALAELLAGACEVGDLVGALTDLPTDQQAAFVEAIATSGHPRAGDVLETIAAEHPDPVIAAAAASTVASNEPGDLGESGEPGEPGAGER